MNKPTWIVFEGIDGSGKTTQAKLLNEYLNKRGVKSVYRHVFDTKAGKLLRELFINNSFSNTVEILILCASRQAFLDEAVANEDYDVIIIDRFFLSILAMQGKEREDVELINYIQNTICRGRDQSIVFHLATSPEECEDRLRNREARDRIEEEGVEFHRMVFERYMTLLRDAEHVHHFNGNGDVETVHRMIVDQTLRVLGIAEREGEQAARQGRLDQVPQHSLVCSVRLDCEQETVGNLSATRPHGARINASQ